MFFKKINKKVAMVLMIGIAVSSFSISANAQEKNNKSLVQSETVDEYQTNLIMESLKNNGISTKSINTDIEKIKEALKEYVRNKYNNLRANEITTTENEILEYILNEKAYHDPIPQYYAAVDLDMKTEEYILNNYGMKISENIDKSIKILVDDIDKIVMETGLSKDDIINKIVALAAISQNQEIINIIDDKLGLGLSKDLNYLSQEDISTYAYNESNAIRYANEYNGKKRNSAFRDFSANGGDCANFVSQILYKGGMTFRNGSPIDNSKYWFCNGKNLNQISSTWRGASMFRWHWQSRAGKITKVSATDTKSKFKTAVYDKTYQGDAMSLLTKEGTPYHTIFITNRNTSSQDFKYAAHSDVGEKDSSKYNSLKNRISGIPVIIYYL